jgi:hypothetical protein
MIQKIKIGRSFPGLLAYLLRAQDSKGATRPRAEIIGGTICWRSKLTILREFHAFSQARRGLKRNVLHVTLRVPREERALSDKEWRAIGKYWADKMGLDAYVIVCHGDHIHIEGSRVRWDGSVVSDSHDFRRGEQVVREIEIRFSLIRTPRSHLTDPDARETHRRSQSQGAIAMKRNSGIRSPSMLVQDEIDKFFANGGASLGDLKIFLANRHIEVLEGEGKQGQTTLYAFRIGGKTVSARKLGEGYITESLIRKCLKNEKRPPVSSRSGSISVETTRRETANSEHHYDGQPVSVRRQEADQSAMTALGADVACSRSDELSLSVADAVARKGTQRACQAGVAVGGPPSAVPVRGESHTTRNLGILPIPDIGSGHAPAANSRVPADDLKRDRGRPVDRDSRNLALRVEAVGHDRSKLSPERGGPARRVPPRDHLGDGDRRAGLDPAEHLQRVHASLKALAAELPTIPSFSFRWGPSDQRAISRGVLRSSLVSKKVVQRLAEAVAAGHSIMVCADPPEIFVLEPISAEQLDRLKGSRIPVVAVSELGADKYSVVVKDVFRANDPANERMSPKFFNALRDMGITCQSRFRTFRIVDAPEAGAAVGRPQSDADGSSFVNQPTVPKPPTVSGSTLDALVDEVRLDEDELNLMQFNRQQL